MKNFSENGAAILAVLFLALVALALSASVMSHLLAVRGQERKLSAAKQAHAAAESGVHQVIARLSGPEGAKLAAGAEWEDDLMGRGSGAPWTVNSAAT